MARVQIEGNTRKERNLMLTSIKKQTDTRADTDTSTAKDQATKDCVLIDKKELEEMRAELLQLMSAVTKLELKVLLMQRS